MDGHRGYMAILGRFRHMGRSKCREQTGCNYTNITCGRSIHHCRPCQAYTELPSSAAELNYLIPFTLADSKGRAESMVTTVLCYQAPMQLPRTSPTLPRNWRRPRELLSTQA